MQVNSENYALAAHHFKPARAARIAQAVERSKSEYQPEHAYTERGWVSLGNADDRHHLEFMVTSLFCDAQYRQALDLVLAVETRALSKEMIDTGTRCAIACGDLENSLKLARAGSQYWKGPFVGVAESAADAFCAAGQSQDAIRPLLTSASNHQPLLSRLAQVLSDREEPEIRNFCSVLLRQGKGVVNEDTLVAEMKLEADLIEPLSQLLRRLQRGALDEGRDRGVHEL